ncbi:MAG: helix-turn-helix domain-containing protein, partial [Sphingobacteriia bacterium]|nr:helix-turn-helix domain-containing protein [Sphingobacteriia bacterium]NCC41229.1 helix-turn-helix domain-containing protein [Gammaproteobacteria bacterium]
MRTVSNTRKRWLAAGLDGLADRPRSGAPAKL